MIYLDNNATTAVAPPVRRAMLPFLDNLYGNPSSIHRFGQESRQAVEHARHQLAALLGCESRDLLFTSGGTESNNAAIHGVLAALPRNGEHLPEKHTIITSTVEHSAVREPLQTLRKSGWNIIEIPVNILGQLDAAALDQALARTDIALVTIMWANNETGVLFDIPALAPRVKAAGAVFHVDAVQAAGKLPIHLKSLPIDLLSISAHKFHGTKGSGALYIRRNTRWVPWQRGGPQERDRRGGTENVPGIVGLGAAAQRAAEHIHDWPQVAALRDRMEQGILAAIPDTHVNGDPASRLPNTTNIAFAALEAEAILLLLSERDICASAGAACSSGSLEPSHVLQAMGIDPRIAHGAIRFSLSHLTTAADIEATLAALPPIIRRLRDVM